MLAPVVRARKGEYGELFRELQTKGYSRVRVDGVVHSLTQPPTLKKQEKHTIDVVVDRLTVQPSSKRRLTDSVETALGLGGGLVTLDFVDLPEDDPHRERVFSEHLACLYDDLSFEELEPRSFSFNSPFGACPECTGLGTRLEVDPELVIPDPTRSLADGAVAPWSAGQTSEYFTRLVVALSEAVGFRMDTPWERLPARAQAAVLRGYDDQVHVRYANRYGRERSYYTRFEGVVPFVERRHAEAESDTSRERFEGYMREVPCPVCKGARLKPVSLAVTLGGRSISDIAAMPIGECAHFLRTLDLSPRERQIAERVLKEVNERLSFLVDVGLDYLSLSRPAATLAGGEAQRIRLATQIGSDSSACSTSSMSRPSGCTSVTTIGSSRRWYACATSETPSSWSSTTRTPSALPTGSSTSGPARGSTAARSSCQARSTTCSPASTRSPATTCPVGARSPSPTFVGCGCPDTNSPSTVPASTTCAT